MKRNETKKQEQNNQIEHKDRPIIRVRSGLRAGAMSDDMLMPAPCC